MVMFNGDKIDFFCIPAWHGAEADLTNSMQECVKRGSSEGMGIGKHSGQGYQWKEKTVQSNGNFDSTLKIDTLQQILFYRVLKHLSYWCKPLFPDSCLMIKVSIRVFKKKSLGLYKSLNNIDKMQNVFWYKRSQNFSSYSCLRYSIPQYQITNFCLHHS